MKRLIIALIFVLSVVFTSLPAFAAENDGKINLNKATVEQLVTITGISQELAEAIIEQRTENGEFVDIEELLEVDGIDSSLLRQLKKFLFIEPASDCNC